MKKYIAFLAVFLFPVLLAFSQSYNPNILINSFGYVSFEPLQMVFPYDDETKFYVGSGVPWGNQSKIDLRFIMSDAEYRFGGEINLEKEYDEDFLRHIVDSASVWITPFPFLRLDIGSFEVGTYQGSYGASDFIQYIGPAEEDWYTIFQNFKGVRGSGVLISITPAPIPELFVGVLINPLLGARYDNYRDQPYDAGEIYKNGQYAVAYTFPDIGIARLQYIGGSVLNHQTVYIEDPVNPGNWIPGPIPVPMTAYNIADLGNPFSIQAAFAYKGINNLTIDMGFTYPLLLKDDTGKVRRPFKLSSAAVYQDSLWTIGGRIDMSFLGWVQAGNLDEHNFRFDFDYGFTMNCNASAGYNFGFATVGGEFSFKYSAPNKGTRAYYDADTNSYDEREESDTYRLTFGLGAWIMKYIGNASIKIGLAVSFPTQNKSDKYSDPDLTKYDMDRYSKGPWVITIPIVFGYWL